MNNLNQSLISYELNIYKNFYENENDYRKDISNKAYKSLTFITALFGAIIWLVCRFVLIYEYQCCYLQVFNIILLFLNSILSIYIIICLFKLLSNYKDTRQDPNKLFEVIKGYKKKSSSEQDIINTIEQSLMLSYCDAAISNYNENQKMNRMFYSVYKWILVDIFITIVTFCIEVLF